MFWSIFKIVAFIAFVTAATFGASMLLDMEGTATINVAGLETTFSILEFVIGLLVIVGLVLVLVKLVGLAGAAFKYVTGDAAGRAGLGARDHKGFDALSDIMMALAAGDGALASERVKRAEKYLSGTALTQVVQAQAAELTGDQTTAQTIYRALLNDDATQFIGLRGMLKQKLAEGDAEAALPLAKQAFAIHPKHAETLDILLRLQAAKSDWTGAHATLTAQLKSNQLDKNAHKRSEAVLALAEAKGMFEAGNTDKAEEAILEANRLSPDLVMAAVMAAQIYTRKNDGRAASRVIKKAWETAPHPDLATAFAAIEPTEVANSRIKRFTALTKMHADDPETKMLIADLNIEARDFAEARRAIADLVIQQPTQRSLTLMATIEREEGASDAVVRRLMDEAAAGPRGSVWVCESCGHMHEDWEPVCLSCGAFGTIAWHNRHDSVVANPAAANTATGVDGEDAQKAPAQG